MGEVKVTQADREAAAASALAAGLLTERDADAVRQGGAWDNWWLVQAFARHRIAAMEEDARVAEDADPLACDAYSMRTNIAAAIRERIDQ